ncbi:hypothetical protein U9M48_029218 [Paspalum notatum var. saurae]|uniref:Glutaredoxin domain-containing protein n=1 Tax=Paspalum notatum var. saurae TaxID=547442 RepID=A0AAQ3U2T5_PASNO
MGCKGSKHALYLHGGCAAAAPEPRRGSRRHSVVALRSATLSLDRAAAAVAAATAGLSFDAAAGGGGGGDDGDGMVMVMVDKKKAGDGGDGDGAAKLLGPSRSFGGWRPATPPLVPQRRAVLVAPRTPSKTPVRGEPPEEINVWELMRGLDDDDDEESDDDESKEEGSRERMPRSAPGSPVFDPELLDAFRKAIDDLAPGGESPLPDSVKRGGGGGEVARRREIPTFPGIVRARVDVFQERINAKAKRLRATTPPVPPPESAGRVVVYLTSLRGVRRTYEDCCSTAAVLRTYAARVDERDLSMHAGFKDELRAALGIGGGRMPPLPQVFADGRHLGGAEEVRRLHETGELAAALEACGDGDGDADADAKQDAACGACGGVRFVPCGACSGSCKVFVEEEDGAGGGAFRRCPECNENGLVRCPVC